MNKKMSEATEISKCISDFLRNYAPLQLSASSHTVRSYETAISLYIAFLESEKSVKPSGFSKECFEKNLIEEWLLWLAKERKSSPETCNNRLASLRTFLKYLGDKNVSYLYLVNDASTVKARKTKKKKICGLSRDAVQALLQEPSPDSITGLRDLTFMVLLYATAARLDEILSLRIRDLHLGDQKPYIVLNGKRNKVRTIYLLPKAVAHLSQYLKRYHDSSPEADVYVFYSRIAGKHEKMTQPAITKMLKKYAATAHEKCQDVPLDLHAHQFRHAKASHWLEDGLNIVQISYLLGHANLETTMVYLDITLEQKNAAMATLLDENDKKVKAKWKRSGNPLADFCGVRSVKSSK